MNDTEISLATSAVPIFGRLERVLQSYLSAVGDLSGEPYQSFSQARPPQFLDPDNVVQVSAGSIGIVFLVHSIAIDRFPVYDYDASHQL